MRKMTTNEELIIWSEPGIERGHGAFQVQRAKRPHDELAIAGGAQALHRQERSVRHSEPSREPESRCSDPGASNRAMCAE